MTHNHDVIIIGSGPAGVSAAFPLLQAGHRVLMLDASQPKNNIPAPEGDYLGLRHQLATSPQWKLAPPENTASSPKFRVPALQSIFSGFAEHNAIRTEDFTVVGSLAAGGLSQAWGAGAAVYDNNDLAEWPINISDLERSYSNIIKRIGICGAAEFFPPNLRAALHPPLKLDTNHRQLLQRHNTKPSTGFSLWHAHNAVLSEQMGERLPCNYSGLCLWGCGRGAIWNASMDLEQLKKMPNVSYHAGVFVQKLTQTENGWKCVTQGNQIVPEFSAKKIFLAAGALGTARIVLATTGIMDKYIAFRSTPSLAFMLWLPKRLGAAAENAFGMAQLGFSIQGALPAYGSLFSASMLPIGEYLAASGLPARGGTALFNALLPSCVVANAFLHGSFSNHQLCLQADGTLRLKGAFASSLAAESHHLKSSLGNAFRKIGAWMIPNSFRTGAIGSDVRYAAMFPMKDQPAALQTTRNGELFGYSGLHLIDASCFSTIAAKPPTLTIMANADRIARMVRGDGGNDINATYPEEY